MKLRVSECARVFRLQCSAGSRLKLNFNLKSILTERLRRIIKELKKYYKERVCLQMAAADALSRHQLLKRLGEGPFSSVVSARDKLTAHKAATVLAAASCPRTRARDGVPKCVLFRF
jgi:hypothetical protein